MRLSIESVLHLRVARLAPAFPVTVTATRGTAVLRRGGFDRMLVPRLPCRVEAFQGFDLLMAGSIAQPAGAGSTSRQQPTIPISRCSIACCRGASSCNPICHGVPDSLPACWACRPNVSGAHCLRKARPSETCAGRSG